MFAGRSVGRGIGVGDVLCLYGTKRQFFKSKINSASRDNEIARLRSAVKIAEKQLDSIAHDSAAGEGQAGIFETHLLFLKDHSLMRKIESVITEERVNSEWAVSSVIAEYSAKYQSLLDKHLREKYIDLEDVGERLIAALGGEREVDYKIEGNPVVVAREINPSTLIEIAAAEPSGLVTENGGWTSHTFILARELGIPAVTGIAKLLRRTETGDKMIVDGYRGEIVIDPSRELIKEYETPERLSKTGSEKAAYEASPVVSTIDGENIRICANLDLSLTANELARVKEFGIGLYRSEYLFKRYSGYPTEDEQYAKYLEIMALAGDSPVKMRTFDLTLEEIVDTEPVRQKNPALGMRGIRLSLRDEAQFRTQIRALLRAGADRNLDIVLPMVSDISELRLSKRILTDECLRLKESGIPYGVPRLGVMIEVPAVLFMIDDVLELIDFVNVGTNDLVQYLLAVDRDNDSIAGYFRTLHPAVIRSLRLIFDAANRHGKEAVVCGEMAGAPLYTPLLIGLGARTLSMNPGSVNRIAGIISKISSQEATEIALKVSKEATADDAEAVLREFYRKTWPHISQFSNYNASPQ